MSKDGEMPLREMVRQLITDSNNFRTEVKTDLATIKVHGEYTKKEIDSNKIIIDSLVASRNKQKGFAYLLSIIGVPTFLEMLKRLIYG